jgi:hypothetical protein
MILVLTLENAWVINISDINIHLSFFTVLQNLLLYFYRLVRHYATSRKVAGWRPDEVNEFFSIYIILPAALCPGVYSGL